MSAERSLFGSVVRSYILSVIGVATAIVVVGSLVAADVVLQRDDGAARALARTMGSELENHPGESLPELDQLVSRELEEQRWFSRKIEVWRAGRRIGGSIADSTLGRWSTGGERCESVHLGAAWLRVCAVRLARHTTAVVATKLSPLLMSLVPFIAAIAAVALVTAFLFALSSRYVVRRSLQPLRRFEESVAGLPALGNDRRVASRWGALEIDTLAHTFNALLERIDLAVEREQRFVADAAHELRTPLTRLRGQIELVLSLGVEGEAKERLGRAVRTCEELARTTEALLALARDQVQLEDAVDLAEVAQLCIQRLDAPSAARVQLQTSESAVVRGDEALLVLALSNLLDNALKYTTGEVWLRVSAEDGTCSLCVQDDGAGVSEEDLLRIREPFVRGRARPTAARGTGLGLALVEHVARLHEGALVLASSEPRGLRAQVSLSAWQAWGHQGACSTLGER